MISLFPQLVGETNQGEIIHKPGVPMDCGWCMLIIFVLFENFLDLTFSKIAPEGTFTPIFSELKLIQKGHCYNLFQTLGIPTQCENTSVFHFSLGGG